MKPRGIKSNSCSIARGFAVLLLCTVVVASTAAGSMAGQAVAAEEVHSLPNSEQDGRLDTCGSLDTLNESENRCLVEAYSPILHFPQQENYRHTSVVEFIKRASVDEGATEFEDEASIDTLGNRDPDSQLIVENSMSYTRYGEAGLPRVVYSHVTETSFNQESYVAVTYWMFYFHDPKKAGAASVFEHQADFESATILVNESGAQYIAGSQHFGGERRQWENVAVTNGTHPHLYPSLGSHSVYFTNTEAYQGNIIGQEQHFEGVDSSSDPLFGILQNAPYHDITGNATTWARTADDWNEHSYSLTLLTGREAWQEYRGSFTRRHLRDLIGLRARAPKYRDRWQNPGRWMESLVPYDDLVQPRVGWQWGQADWSGSIGESNVTVSPEVWNQRGVIPARFYVEVVISDSDGTVLGQNTTIVKRKSGNAQIGQRPTAEVTVPIENPPDSVTADVRVYSKPPAAAASPADSIEGDICRSFMCLPL